MKFCLDQFKCYLSDADLVKVQWPLLHTGIFELVSVFISVINFPIFFKSHVIINVKKLNILFQLFIQV